MKTKTTTVDIADLVEYALNETEPKIKTRRGIGNEVELNINRKIFLVTVTKPKKEGKNECKDRTY